jgi:co-chaperonin GroES (HSP10)
MAIFDLKGRVLRAVNDKVVVQKASRPDRSKGGLFLPQEDVRTYCEGKVLSVGPDVKSCKAGDEIIWQVFRGQAAGHHDEERWCVEDKDVLAVIEPATPLAAQVAVELPASAEVVEEPRSPYPERLTSTASPDCPVSPDAKPTPDMRSPIRIVEPSRPD